MLLKGLNGVIIEHSLIFKFKISNSQAKYEALVPGLLHLKDVRAQ